MSDTLELLEAIGQDASLRHASAGELAHALERAAASPALKAAAASGDSTHLSAEFGHRPMYAPQTQTPGYEEDLPEHEGDGEENPLRPSTPDDDTPSLQQ